MGEVTDLTNQNDTSHTAYSDFASQVYDAVGNQTSVTASLPAKTTYGGLTTYQYDSKDQLTQEQSARNGGYTDGFGYGFLINGEDYDGGRAAGSLAWAGIDNTFFWIDPQRKTCAVLMMQFLPFCDSDAVAVLRDFEHGIYATVRKT